MRLDQKITFIRAKLRWLAQDMEQWALLSAAKDSIYEEYQGTTEEILNAFSLRIESLIQQMDNPKSCPSSCKRMYFCELEKGHDGIHREGGLGWSEEDSDSAPLDCFNEKETDR